MNIRTFFNKLHQFYNEVGKTKYQCKFYLQDSSFSYEIHDSYEQCFTKMSLKKESEIYYSWDNSETMKQIIDDIIGDCKNLAKIHSNRKNSVLKNTIAKASLKLLEGIK